MPLKSMASLRELSIKTWIAIAVSMFIRISTMFLVGGDPQAYLIPWVTYIREHGLEAYFSQGITNYPYSYNFFLYLMSLTGIGDFGINTLVRVISYIADIFLAYVISLISLEEFKLDFHKTFLLSYFGAFLYTNSCVGQCDSIWASLGLFAIYNLKHKKYTIAVLFLGFALAFKLQAVCFVPVFLLYILLTKCLYIKYWALLLLGWLIPQIPLILCGAPFKYVLSPYLGQATQCDQKSLAAYPTIFYFICVPYTWTLIIGCAVMLITILVFWRLLTLEQFNSNIYVILGFFAFYTFALISGSLERYGFVGYVLTPLLYLYTKNKLVYCFSVLMTFLTALTYVWGIVPAAYGYMYFLLMSLIILAKYIFTKPKEEVKCS